VNSSPIPNSDGITPNGSLKYRWGVKFEHLLSYLTNGVIKQCRRGSADVDNS